eukprot:CAMPEP_0173279746 /NCGR_PEP_ID=MMETSP1143-20121109/5319_1 /TAXON_ID=483371 /ORGANISM="non described non described, Strain CCMP2298" /LENGTH=157 /DNA_ID=CAMNT_0014217007 /DNA_START=347 /DNA_END=820 /DNA_ORIENTATION=+
MSISPTKEGTVSASSSDQSKAAPISPTALVEPSSATIAMGEMMTVWYPMVSAGEGMAGFGAGSASGGSTASHWERTALILRAAAQRRDFSASGPMNGVGKSLIPRISGTRDCVMGSRMRSVSLSPHTVSPDLSSRKIEPGKGIEGSNCQMPLWPVGR